MMWGEAAILEERQTTKLKTTVVISFLDQREQESLCSVRCDANITFTRLLPFTTSVS